MIIKQIEDLIEEADGETSTLDDTLKSFGNKFDTIIANGKKTADELGSDLADFFNKAKSGIGTVLDNVKKEIERTPGNLKQIGQNIKDEAERTPGNIKQIGQNIKDEIERTPDNIKDMYAKTAVFAQKTLDKITNGSENFADVVSDYFVPYQSNPVVRDLVKMSMDNPHAFSALVVAVPLVLVGALSAGSYAIVKKIKNMKEAQAELEKAGTELEKATTDSAKATATKKVALIGAKMLVLSKSSK